LLKWLYQNILCQNSYAKILVPKWDSANNQWTYPCKNTFYAISQHHYLTSKHADQIHLLPKDLFSKIINTFMESSCIF
jgi:hypothetical protein